MAQEHAAWERMIETLAPLGEAERRRALVIVNPHATAITERLRTLVIHALASRYDVDVAETQSRGHATELAGSAAREGYGLVIAFGGDGTANEAANGLVGSTVPLTCLPGGSANVFCKLLGIPGELVDATEHLLRLADRFVPRQVDVGVVEGRHFLFSAGVGVDANVVRRVDSRPRLKRRFGPYFFSAVAAGVFVRRYAVRAPRLFVAVDGETFAGVTAVVQNGEHYTYFHDRAIDLAQGATLDGGTLAGVVLRRASLIGIPALVVRALRGGVVGHRRVAAFAGAASVTVSTAAGRPAPLQVDGDYLGEVTEARFQIRPRALTVVA
jgi:diacylglycerol kinase family enzyme